MRWPVATTVALDGAAEAACAGEPRVLAIEGEAGFGKSTLLREAVSRLDGFHVLRGFGDQTAQDDRFQLLQEWRGGGAPPRHTLQAGRMLAQVVDGKQLTGPVALVVDDLQWIDPESVQALAELAERAVGDRLLVLTAHRPLRIRHPGWRRLSAPTIRLQGLDEEAAVALVAAYAPDAPHHLAEQLRAHTGGNPLHMRALIQEYSWPVLAGLVSEGELPAPADLAAAVDARLSEIAPEAAGLLYALAVVGDTWTDLPTAAAVGGVSDADTAVSVLIEENLVRLDRTNPAVPRVRISHAVLRAAAYKTIPVSTRRRLHKASAARLTDPGSRLRHRIGAASGPDAGLAADLDRFADDRHGQGLFREAARYRRLAASTSGDLVAREQRLLDADVEAILARELHDVSVTTLGHNAGAHRRFVWALRLSAARRWVESCQVFDELDPDELAPINAFYARVLYGWTIFASGRPPELALPPLQAAATAPVQDAVFRRLFVMVYGQVMQVTTGRADPLWGFDKLRGVERSSLASSSEGLAGLSWRGSVYAVNGATESAIGDLTIVTRNINDGVMEPGDGEFQAFLGLAYWAAGEWRRGSINFGLALAAAPNLPTHPIVSSTAPLAALVAGEDLGPSLARSRESRLAGPIPVSMYVGDVAEIAALAFTGDHHAQQRWRARRTADFGAPHPPVTHKVPSMWMLAMGIGAAWAEDPEATDAWADALMTRTEVPWRTNAVAWLRGLADRVRGETVSLTAVARAGLPGLDTFAALLWADAVRFHAEPAVQQLAQDAFTRIGAAAYATKLLPTAVTPDDPLTQLSAREREVATLLLEGLSYSQIANELYVTRSTVAFHLSNIYAKTGTTTRHEFIHRLRRAQS